MQSLGAMSSLYALQDLEHLPCLPKSSLTVSGRQLPIAPFHADMCSMKEERTQHWLQNTTAIFKQHLPPTDVNVKAIRKWPGAKVIVLLRNPWAASNSRCEANRVGLWDHRAGSAAQLLAVAEGHVAFHRGWSQVAHESPEHFFLIRYEHMYNDTTAQVAQLERALQFFGAPQRHPFINHYSRFLSCGNASCARDFGRLRGASVRWDALIADDPGAWAEWEEQMRAHAAVHPNGRPPHKMCQNSLKSVKDSSHLLRFP